MPFKTQTLHYLALRRWHFCQSSKVPLGFSFSHLCWKFPLITKPMCCGPQCQLSLAEPRLLMARRGLRDTEPLFFQRTFPKLAGNVDTLGALGVPVISGSLLIPSPCGNVAHPPCQSLSACWKDIARQAVMSFALSARLHQKTLHCNCWPGCLHMYRNTLGLAVCEAQYAMSCK